MVWIAFPGGIVDVFLNLASLDMTATVLSNAASGKKMVSKCPTSSPNFSVSPCGSLKART